MMAPKPAGKQPLPDDHRLVRMMPAKLSGHPEIEKQAVRLIVEDETIGGSGGAYRAKLLYGDRHPENCVALCRRRSRAFEAFEFLNACSHPNIAKPIGVWEDEAKKLGYIVFQNFDGALSSVPKQVIFEVENLLEPKPAMHGFSEKGFNILWDLMSAVNYVNDHYQQEPSQTENYLPLKSLRMEACTVFFQLKEEGDYLVLLTDFEIDTGESSQNIKGHKRRGAKAKARSSGEQPDVHQIRTRNWNNMGEYISQLCAGCSANFEVTHLIDSLKNEAAKYDDLLWEAGLWDLTTKIYFLHEIFWCYDKAPGLKADLNERLPLGLQSCIIKLNVREKANNELSGVTPPIMKEWSLYKSLHFLRVFLFAHQADILEKYSGPKGDIQDRKSAERFVLEHKSDYMVRIIEEIRDLKCIKTSPYLRSRHNYMIERHHPQEM